jgi:hypothetical protein
MLHDSHSPQDTPSVDTPTGLTPPNTTPAAQVPRPGLCGETPSTHSIRRNNLHELLTAFAQQQLAAGQATKGIEQAFAAHLQISPSMLSQIKRNRNISDALAKQIERLTGKTDGWLSQQHPLAGHNGPPQEVISEEAVINLVREKWRSADDEQRKRMVRQIQGLGDC